jgi:hypothetical protein
MRRMRPGRAIARVAVGTAVVAGTAGAVSHHQQQKYANQDAAAQQSADVQALADQQAAQQAQLDQMQQQQAPPPQAYAPPPQAYAPPPPPAPAPVADNSMTGQLQQLAQLHSQGILTDEEFAAAKQKVLAGG